MRSGPGSYITRSKVIDIALPHINGRKLVLQAGGHLGVWPKKLAEHFERVLTVEPEPRNVECLRANTEGLAVEIFVGVLGSNSGIAKVNNRETSTGSHHIATRMDVPWIEVPMFTIDQLCEGRKVDAIFLDVEGYELNALRGATRILADRPTMVIEQNACAKKFDGADGLAEKFLYGLGYRRVATFDEDVILVC